MLSILLASSSSDLEASNMNMNSAKLIGVIDDTNFQDVIPKKVPGNTDESAPQFANEIIDNITGEALEYQHLITKEKYWYVWINYFGKYLDQLAQGRSQLASGTNTLFFWKCEDIQSERRKDVTYGRVVVD